MTGQADTYAALRAAHRWELPATFNFGGDVVDRWAEDPAKLAIIWTSGEGATRRLTFGDVKLASNRLANALADGGVRRGDRVVVMLPRIPEWQIAMVACFKLGAVPIPCITMLTAKDIAYRAVHAEAVAAITAAGNEAKFDGLDRLRVRLSVGTKAPGWLDLDAAMAGAADQFTPAPLGLEEMAILYYTSGSTGNPKGVAHGARSLFAWRVAAEHWLSLGPDDLMWCTADTGWSKAGTSILIGPWSRGAAVLMHDGPFDARRRFELMAEHRVTVFCAAATELRRLMREDISGLDLSALRHATSAGESVNPDVVVGWQALTGTPVYDGYGHTEGLMNVLNYPFLPVRPGSMGKPQPGVEVGLIGEDDRLVGAGETGQIALRLPCPHMMLGYYRDPEQSARAVRRIGGVDYYLTGDVGTVDADGYYFYRGRVDDVINSAGYRIGPLEVENALLEHPAVLESAAVASPDPARGEIVCAYVVLKPGNTAGDELTAALQDTVKRVTAPYKYPRKIVYVDDLPKTATGKVRRRDLQAREFAAG